MSLSTIRARLEAASPGQWHWNFGGSLQADSSALGIYEEASPHTPQVDADMELIAHSHEDIRLLLDVATAASREKSPGPNCRCADGFACEWCQGLAEATGKALTALEQAP